jgi:probable DNA metabolism protein
VEQITFAPSFAAWQKAARAALQRSALPDGIIWEELAAAEPGLNLFDEKDSDAAVAQRQFVVPKKYVTLARLVALHRDAQRWGLLYRLLWRLTHEQPKLLEISIDPGVVRVFEMEKSVRHDIHKMRAFVRFREVEVFGSKWFVAWFEPEHYIVEHNARFFVDRFVNMKWSILTPDRCVHWDGLDLRFTEGVDRSQAPSEDRVERLWLTYYKSIFNPARTKVHAMQAEMPKRYWKNLPETAVIPALLREAPGNVQVMMKKKRDQDAKRK